MHVPNNRDHSHNDVDESDFSIELCAEPAETRRSVGGTGSLEISIIGLFRRWFTQSFCPRCWTDFEVSIAAHRKGLIDFCYGTSPIHSEIGDREPQKHSRIWTRENENYRKTFSENKTICIQTILLLLRKNLYHSFFDLSKSRVNGLRVNGDES